MKNEIEICLPITRPPRPGDYHISYTQMWTGTKFQTSTLSLNECQESTNTVPDYYFHGAWILVAFLAGFIIGALLNDPSE